MIQNQYQTIEWLSKRQIIIERDNFTCQSCRQFDPSSGSVKIFNSIDQDFEFHRYNSSSSEYILTSSKNSITLTIDFHWGTWLVMPILQVHHKRYIESIKIWEYANEDLTTLCKSCHTETHQKNKIEIYNKAGVLINSKYFEPSDFGYRPAHDFKPWVFINKDGDQYKLSDVNPFIRFFVFENDLEKLFEKEITAKKMVDYFFERFLTDYSPKKP
jgi:5-methylcytosine-specific restriction endonuclease McrA